MSEKPTFLFQKHFDLLDDDDDIINGSVNVENIEPPVSDIEDLVSDEEDEPLDKARYIQGSYGSSNVLDLKNLFKYPSMYLNRWECY